jgi:hypothetical protein
MKITDKMRLDWLIRKEGLIEKGSGGNHPLDVFFRVHWMPENVPTAWFDTGRQAIDAAIRQERRRKK